MTSWHPGDRDYHDPSILRIPTKPPAQHGITKGFEHCSSEKNPGSRSPWCCLIFRRTSQVATAKPGFHQWLLKVQGQPSGSLQIAAQHEDLIQRLGGRQFLFYITTRCAQDWGRPRSKAGVDSNRLVSHTKIADGDTRQNFGVTGCQG